MKVVRYTKAFVLVAYKYLTLQEVAGLLQVCRYFRDTLGKSNIWIKETDIAYYEGDSFIDGAYLFRMFKASPLLEINLDVRPYYSSAYYLGLISHKYSVIHFQVSNLLENPKPFEEIGELIYHVDDTFGVYENFRTMISRIHTLKLKPREMAIFNRIYLYYADQGLHILEQPRRGELPPILFGKNINYLFRIQYLQMKGYPRNLLEFHSSISSSYFQRDDAPLTVLESFHRIAQKLEVDPVLFMNMFSQLTGLDLAQSRLFAISHEN